MTILIALIAFLIAIMILVSIHEFGHYWVAKKCGVDVLNFSIGFGPTLISWQREETTYHIKAIPLGGFVDMLDGDKHKLSSENQNRAFNNKSVYQRFMIVLAGPLANILLAIVLYMLSAMMGVNDLKAIVDEVLPHSIAAQAGLKPGDKFIEINQKPTPGIKSVMETFISSDKVFNISVLDKNKQLQILTLNLQEDWLDEAKRPLNERLGFRFFYPSPKAIIDKVLPDSPAAAAGLFSGDEIVAINNISVATWQQMRKQINKTTNQPLLIDVLRNQKRLQFSIFPQIKNAQPRLGISVKIPKDFFTRYQLHYKYNISTASIYAINRTYEIFKLNTIMFWRLLSGRASSEHLSGPIGIAYYAGENFANIQAYLNFLGLLSIAIAFFNLLPIPLLDGGHLFLYLIEILRKKPLEKKLRDYFNHLGILFIVIVLSIALYNDTVDFILS